MIIYLYFCMPWRTILCSPVLKINQKYECEERFNTQNNLYSTKKAFMQWKGNLCHGTITANKEPLLFRAYSHMSCLVRFELNSNSFPHLVRIFGQVWIQQSHTGVRTNKTEPRPCWRGGLGPHPNELWYGWMDEWMTLSTRGFCLISGSLAKRVVWKRTAPNKNNQHCIWSGPVCLSVGRKPCPILEFPPRFGVPAPIWRSPGCSYTVFDFWVLSTCCSKFIQRKAERTQKSPKIN